LLKKRILLLLSVYALILISVYARQCYLRAHPARSTGQEVRIQLRRGPFTVFKFAPSSRTPLAMVLFRSGDGGWGPWEDTVAQALRRGGYEVIGIDSADYAKTDYDLSTLEADSNAIAAAALAPFGKNPPPLILGGWSMGAGQAIAIAGGPNPPRTVGLLLASPLSRGRYGLRLSDQLNILPRGPGTFAVENFAHRLRDLRIVQWHGGDDWIDSRAWLKDLTADHREYDLPHGGHTYAGASPEFLQQFVASAGWIIRPNDPPRNLIGEK
jgi:phosphatidylglycerol lysyltransferase